MDDDSECWLKRFMENWFPGYDEERLENGDSRLCRFPNSILESLVKALDEYSLIKIRMTCYQMNLRLKRFSKRFRRITLRRLSIVSAPCICQKCNYLVEFEDDTRTVNTFGFPLFVSGEAPPISNESGRKIANRHICLEKTVVEWLDEQPNDMIVNRIELGSLNLDNRKLVALEHVFTRKNVRASCVQLEANEYGDMRLLVRMLNCLRMSYLNADVDYGENKKHLLSGPFLEFISTIQGFVALRKGNSLIHLPKGFYRFPRNFRIEGGGVLIDIDSFRTAIRAWNDDQLDLKELTICLPTKYRKADVLAEAIGLEHLPDAKYFGYDIFYSPKNKLVNGTLTRLKGGTDEYVIWTLSSNLRFLMQLLTIPSCSIL